MPLDDTSPVPCLDWIAVDRSAWRVELHPGRILLRCGTETIDLPQDRWKSDLYVAAHADAFIIRVETFQRAVGFLVPGQQAQAFLHHVAAAAAPRAQPSEETPTVDPALLFPRVSPLAVWAVLSSSLAFLPIVGVLPAIVSIILLVLHRRRVLRTPAFGHSRLLCVIAASLVGVGLVVSGLSSWGLVDTLRRTPAPRRPTLELTRPVGSAARTNPFWAESRSVGSVDGGVAAHHAKNHALALVARMLPRLGGNNAGVGIAARDFACENSFSVPLPREFVSANGTYRAGVLDEDHNWGLIAAALFVVLLSLTVHEAAHAISAWWLGDDFARRLGRVTLNPLAHIDPVGTVLLPLILFFAGAGVFGWAKPVPVRLDYVPRPRRAQILIALAGPGSNLLLAAASLMFLLAISCILARVAPATRLEHLMDGRFTTPVSAGGFLLAPVVGPICTILKLSFLINIFLAFFNLIPIPPLDGSWVLEHSFPRTLGPIYERIRPMSFILFLGLIYTNALDHLLRPAWFVVDFGFALLSLCAFP